MTNHNPANPEEQPGNFRYIDRTTGTVKPMSTAKAQPQPYISRADRTSGTLHLPVREPKPQFEF
jgi:hypothetical protein